MKRYPPRMAPMEPPLLDYQGPVPRRRYFSDRRANAVTAGVAGGIVITVPALLLAIFTGVGRGDPFFACVLFPIPMCVSVFGIGSIDPWVIAMAPVQFPIYGAVIGYYSQSRRTSFRVAILALLAVHCVAFIICVGSGVLS